MSNGFEDYIVQARQQAEAGQLDEAIMSYRGALEEDPTNEDIRREIINLTLRKGDFESTIVEYFDWAEACQVQGAIDDAIRIYQEILGLDTLLKKKIFMMDQKVAHETIAQIKETIQAASGAIFFNLGYLYLEKGALDEAISCLQKSLEFNPSDAKTHTLLGQVFMQKGLDSEATGEFQEVVRLAPEEAAYAYEMLGEIFVRKGKPPQNTIVWFRNAGDLYLRHEQVEEAIRAYERILSLEPRNKDVLTRLGEIYAKQDEKDKALEIYRELAEIYSNEGLLDKVVVIYEKLVEWDPENEEAREKIIDIYNKILTIDPSNLTARHKLIGNLLRKGSAEEAIPQFLALSKTYLEKGMKKEAFAVCRKLLELNPREANAHELIADIIFGQGKKEEALKEYLYALKLYQDGGDEDASTKLNERLLEMYPGTKQVAFHMALTYKKRQDYDLALEEFKKIMADEPANVTILQHIMDIYEAKEELDKVIEYAYKIVNLDNTRTDMQDKIISIYQKQGNTQKIITIYEYMLKVDPSRSDIRNKILEIYEQEGRQDKIIEMYQNILEQEPDRINIRQKLIQYYATEGLIEKMLGESSILADVFLKNDDLAKAESLYKNVLAFIPGDIGIRSKLYNIYEQKGEVEKVQDELMVLASISYSANDIEGSVKNCQKLLEYVPNDINIKNRIACMSADSGNTVEAVNQYRDVAEIYLDKKMTEPAKEMIGNILEIDSENIEYREKLIKILKEQLKVEEAIQHYKILISHFLRFDQNNDAITGARDAIALLPMDLDLRKEIAELFLSGRDLDNARVFADELIDIFLSRSEYEEVNKVYSRLSLVYQEKGDMEVYYEMRENIARILERQTKYDEAIKEYLGILEGNMMESRKGEAEKLFPVLIGLYFKGERPEQAVENFQALSDKLYKFGKLNESLLSLEHIEEIQQRIEDYDKALETLKLIIKYHEEKNDIESIIKAYKRCIDIHLRLKDTAMAINEMFSIIQRYLEMGNLDSAIEQFNEIESFESDRPDIIARMAETLFEYEKFEKAKELYEKVLELDAENFDAMARIAIVLAKAGNLQDAVVYTKKIFSKGLVAEVIDEYMKSSEVDPDDAQIHINMGLFYQEMGFVEEAIHEFQLAARDKDRLLEAYDLLAKCFKQEGFIDLAIRQLERALEKPGYPEEDYLAIRYNLGETLLENNQLQEALSAFYECYMVDINYKDISEKIAMINEKLSAAEEAGVE
ncbi:MAG: tetratricopeptide repeat protein [Candidatus Eremiobacteraeota bacterium]|nr:tetratricopeptide repeat protein [Candidatus Eremiobacteraeota bacterium]